MKTEQSNNESPSAGLVDAQRLLEALFPNPVCRPSVRWLRTQVAERTVPFVRIGRLCFFDARLVKSNLDSRAMGKVRTS
ncbi:MAG: hypothetical protein WCS42_08285 [Verrucomicrobiota bacterium]